MNDSPDRRDKRVQITLTLGVSILLAFATWVGFDWHSRCLLEDSIFEEIVEAKTFVAVASSRLDEVAGQLLAMEQAMSDGSMDGVEQIVAEVLDSHGANTDYPSEAARLAEALHWQRIRKEACAAFLRAGNDKLEDATRRHRAVWEGFIFIRSRPLDESSEP